jgi:hypothetical protein
MEKTPLFAKKKRGPMSFGNDSDGGFNFGQNPNV